MWKENKSIFFFVFHFCFVYRNNEVNNWALFRITTKVYASLLQPTDSSILQFYLIFSVIIFVCHYFDFCDSKCDRITPFAGAHLPLSFLPQKWEEAEKLTKLKRQDIGAKTIGEETNIAFEIRCDKSLHWKRWTNTFSLVGNSRQIER